MRFLICGSRDWWDRGTILQWIKLHVPPESTVIHGDARGADRIAGQEAILLGHAVDVFPALWNAHGKSAGYIRNQQMLDEGRPDLVVYSHDDLEGSRGTKDMVSRAMKAGIPVCKGVV